VEREEETGSVNIWPPKPIHDYVDLPPEAPQPRIWKCIGHAMPGLELQYGLETFNGDMDIDREIELRVELAGMAQALNSDGALFDGMTLAQQFGRQLVVRFVACSCGTNLYTTRN
jgi:hypothetical protein